MVIRVAPRCHLKHLFYCSSVQSEADGQVISKALDLV